MTLTMHINYVYTFLPRIENWMLRMLFSNKKCSFLAENIDYFLKNCDVYVCKLKTTIMQLVFIH